MTYKETLEYLYFKLPIFQKEGKKAFKPKLENIQLLCDFLDNPEKKLKFIHVGGTNGKGSTSHLLASVLMEHDFQIGLYTSPHLKSFTERIKINNKEITEQSVIDFVEIIKPAINDLSPSFFEVTVAMSFWYFAQEKPDYVILEVGMGGRLDSTNIISPLLSIITNISLDHTQYLGDTLEKIAFEKAGIIKPNTPVVIGEVQKESFPVFQKVAEEKKALLHSDDVELELFTKLKTNGYQDNNIKTCLKTLSVLSRIEGLHFSKLKITNGITNFATIAGLKGRWQILSNTPKTICDTGHNVAGVKQVTHLLKQENYDQLHIVWGMVKEKDVNSILQLLPKNATYYFCQGENDRMLSAKELHIEAQQHNLNGTIHHSVEDAIQQAQKSSTQNDLIFIGGSTFVVAEIPFL